MTVVPKNVLTIVKKLQDAGFQAFIVGGAVRDMCRGAEPHDFDITTSATPDEIKTVFKSNDFSIVPVGEAFGIVVVNHKASNTTFEIATFRQDVGGSDGRHPDSIIMVADVREDLSRRDFTMNAIAFDPVEEVFVDPTNGKRDIQHEIISFVGDPESRLMEDRLRLLRAVRFAAKLNWTFSVDTKTAIEKWAKRDDVFAGISQERITQEFSKILISGNVEVIAWMAEIGLLQKIIPEVQTLIDCDHQSPWHNEVWEPFGNTVFAHVLFVLLHTVESEDFKQADDDKKLILMLAGLFHDIGKPQCKVLKEV